MKYLLDKTVLGEDPLSCKYLIKVNNEFLFLIFCKLRSSKRTDSHPTVEIFREQKYTCLSANAKKNYFVRRIYVKKKVHSTSKAPCRNISYFRIRVF